MSFDLEIIHNLSCIIYTWKTNPFTLITTINLKTLRFPLFSVTCLKTLRFRLTTNIFNKTQRWVTRVWKNLVLMPYKMQRFVTNNSKFQIFLNFFVIPPKSQKAKNFCFLKHIYVFFLSASDKILHLSFCAFLLHNQRHFFFFFFPKS